MRIFFLEKVIVEVDIIIRIQIEMIFFLKLDQDHLCLTFSHETNFFRLTTATGIEPVKECAVVILLYVWFYI